MKRLLSLMLILTLIANLSICSFADSKPASIKVRIELTELGETLAKNDVVTEIYGVPILKKDILEDGQIKKSKLHQIENSMKNQDKSNFINILEVSNIHTRALIPDDGYKSATIVKTVDYPLFKGEKRELYLSVARAIEYEDVMRDQAGNGLIDAAVSLIGTAFSYAITNPYVSPYGGMIFGMYGVLSGLNNAYWTGVADDIDDLTDANKKVKVVHVHDSYVKYTTVSEWDGSYIDTSLGNYQTIADIRYYID